MQFPIWPQPQKKILPIFISLIIFGDYLSFELMFYAPLVSAGNHLLTVQNIMKQLVIFEINKQQHSISFSKVLVKVHVNMYVFMNIALRYKILLYL